MALAFHMTGPVQISWASETIGIAEDRVNIQFQPYWDEIHTDDYGGLAGPPGELQLLGAVAFVSATLTKFDEDLAHALHGFGGGTGDGATIDLPTLGTFAFQDGLYDALVLTGTIETNTFSKAILRQAQEFNASMRHKRFGVGWQCYLDDTCTRQLMARVSTGSSSCA